jgi:hypothetical protein
VVDVAHDRHDRRALDQVLVGVLELRLGLHVVGRVDDLDLLGELLGEHLDGLVGQGLGERGHLPQVHEGLDHLGDGDAERLGGLLDRRARVDADDVQRPRGGRGAGRGAASGRAAGRRGRPGAGKPGSRSRPGGVRRRSRARAHRPGSRGSGAASAPALRPRTCPQAVRPPREPGRRPARPRPRARAGPPRSVRRRCRRAP